MKHHFISGLGVLLLTLLHGISYGQQGNVWTFGAGARVNFATPIPTTTVGTSSISTYEGCASMADNAGNLLFYTDGTNVWNSTNTLLTGTLNGHFSAAQSAIIVPEPGTTPGSSTGRYYIFTVPQLATNRVFHTIYDGTSLINLNTPMPDHATAANTTEGITVARHCNGIDYWVITHEFNNNRFKAYQVTNTGVMAPVTSNVGPAAAAGMDNINAACCMKMSPSNNRLAFCVRQTSVNLFDFNPSTGAISTPVTVTPVGGGHGYYGVEFSPDGNVLYYTDFFVGLHAFDIAGGTRRMVSTVAGTGSNGYIGLQLAPNGKIYMAKDGDSNMSNLNQTWLGRIDNPNSYPGATYVANGLQLAAGTGVKCGLPNIIPSLITPQINIAGHRTICIGNSTTLTATGGTNYMWSPATGLDIAFGATVVASPESTQTYTVTDTANHCTATRQVTITAVECCDAGMDEVYTPIFTDPHYTTPTVLSGKYYVAPGVVITVDETTLDLTNVDMIFDECAGINFINSQVIAYNSVFRPCDDASSWLGFSFERSQGSISESTFKNAQKAIWLERQSSVRITNNNFLNNQISVCVFDNTQSEAISGNEFTVNNVEVDYQNCDNTYGNNDAFAILARRADFRDVISQNNFVNADFNHAKRVYGIYFTDQTSNANISSNFFTNQYTSIYASNCEGLSVLNNTAELTSLYTYPGTSGDDIQFYFPKGTNNTIISGNKLTGRPLYSNFGIYIDGNSNMSVTGNELGHFKSCIVSSRSNNMNVVGNTLTNTIVGIYSINSRTAYYGCNVIDCLEDNSTGIAFEQSNDSDAGCAIVGNCIYNTYNAISLNTSIAGGYENMPLILNNFLYSYRNFGIVNSNFSGDIGSGITGLTAGKNTFASNNVAGGAVDISTNTPLTAYGNYGIATISGGVALTGSNTFYSTAACGNQLGNATTEYSSYDLCQNFPTEPAKVFVLENGALAGEFEADLAQLNNEDQFPVLRNIAALISSPVTSSDMIRVQNFVQQSDLSSNDKSWILATLYTDQPEVASAHLASISGMAELVSIEQINLATMRAPMTEDQYNELMALQESPSENREKAREALNVYAGRFPYRLDHSYAFVTADVRDAISVDQNSLLVFPNPANELVSIQVAIPSNEGSELRITDLSGKVIFNSELKADFVTMDIDVSKLNNGMYIVTIMNEDKLILTSKLSVLNR